MTLRSQSNQAAIAPASASAPSTTPPCSSCPSPPCRCSSAVLSSSSSNVISDPAMSSPRKAAAASQAGVHTPTHLRASPRLALKQHRSHTVPTGASESELPFRTSSQSHTPISKSRSQNNHSSSASSSTSSSARTSSATSSAAHSSLQSRSPSVLPAPYPTPSSTSSSPNLHGLDVNARTPLSKTRSGRLVPPMFQSMTPSPIALPLSLAALAGAHSSDAVSSSARSHHAAAAAGCGLALTRSASCPVRAEHKLSLPATQSESVNFISVRTAAMILLASHSKIRMNNLPVSDLPTIANLSSAEQATVAEWANLYDAVHIIDARFPYEYNGGHIRGAVNITSYQEVEELLFKFLNKPPQMDAQPSTTPSSADTTMSDSPPAPYPSNSRTCVLIHCEFSRHRGPKCFKYIRKRDRDTMGVEFFPTLIYPEVYCISGGYQSFFTSGFQSFCSPQEYVSMVDKRFLKEYAENWKKMKRSSSQSMSTMMNMSSSPRVGEGRTLVNDNESVGGGSGGGNNGSGTGSSTPGQPPHARQTRSSRTRSWSEMHQDRDSSSSVPNTAYSSPALIPRSLHSGGSITPSPINGSNTTSSPIPSHPRVSRGLSLILDSTAQSGARRPLSSAFSFHSQNHTAVTNSPSNSASAAAPPQQTSSFTFTPSLSASSPVQTPTSSMYPSALMPGCASPSFGWAFENNEGRTSTPSPFQAIGDSPRFSSMNSAQSPVPMLNGGWGAAAAAAAASNTAMGNLNGTNAAALAMHNASRATPTHLIDEKESPRFSSRSSSSWSNPSAALGPPVFTNAKTLIPPLDGVMTVPAVQIQVQAPPTENRSQHNAPSPSHAMGQLHLRNLSSPTSHNSSATSKSQSLFSQTHHPQRQGSHAQLLASAHLFLTSPSASMTPQSQSASSGVETPPFLRPFSPPLPQSQSASPLMALDDPDSAASGSANKKMRRRAPSPPPCASMQE